MKNHNSIITYEHFCSLNKISVMLTSIVREYLRCKLMNIKVCNIQ